MWLFLRNNLDGIATFIGYRVLLLTLESDIVFWRIDKLKRECPR